MKSFKKYLPFLPLLVFLGLAIPRVSYANWLFKLSTNIMLGIPALIIHLFARVIAFLVELSAILLSWVLSPDFIRLSYTNPARNEIIRTGLSVTQGLVNMVLVLILIYIAIATILRLKEYEAQKLLPKFIIIALLVNFTPVICGVIVDASNIIMNFFVSDLHADSVGTTMKGLIDGVAIGWGDITSFSEESLLPKLIETIILCVFMMFLIVILLIFTAVFIIRYMAIWILVILSPIAFIAYILPITKKYWSLWWEQFINWCLVGVTCGFFLYLSIFFMMGISRDGYILPPEQSPADTTQSFQNIIPYITGIVFLLIGLVFGLKTSAMGSATVINLGRSKGQEYVKRASARGAAFTAAATAGAWRGAGKGAKEGAKGKQGGRRISGAIAGSLGGAAKGAGTYKGREEARGSGGKLLERMHLVRPGAYEEGRKKRWKTEEEVKRLEKLPTSRVEEIAERKAITPADKRAQLGAIEVLAKRGSLKDKHKEQVKEMQALGGDISQALKARPDWAEDFGKEVNEQIKGVNTRDFTKNIQAEALESPEVIMSLDAPKIRHMSLNGTTEQKKALREAVNESSQTYKDIFTEASKKYAENTKESIQEGNRIMDILAEIQDNANLKT